MSSSTPDKQKSLQPTEKRPFYIVGPKMLQNELIASCLKQETGNECFVLEQIDHIPKDVTKDRRRPELVILDCHGKDLKRILNELRSYNIQDRSGRRIVLFNVNGDQGFQKKCVLDGIHGVFYEHDPIDIFLKGVQAILDGKLWLSRDMMTKCIFEGSGQDKSSKSGSEDLTERQIQILALVAVGATNDEIADKLCISPHTVKTHLYRIFKNINVPNRVQASLWAAKNL
jgi:DNA-binding NarL/FixJ family response regulator